MGWALRKLDLPPLKGRSFVAQHLPRRRLRVVDELDCDAVACERVRSYLFEIGRTDKNLERGWMIHAAEKAGLNYATARSIIHRDKTVMGLHVAKQISAKTGIPVHIFYDVTAS